jgi:hypothetical protein
MNIRDYTFEEFVDRVKAFHGYEAPVSSLEAL